MWGKLTTTKKALVSIGGILGVFMLLGAIAPKTPDKKPDTIQVANTAAQTKAAETSKKPVIKTETKTEDESIPFTATTVDDASLDKGKNRGQDRRGKWGTNQNL